MKNNEKSQVVFPQMSYVTDTHRVIPGKTEIMLPSGLRDGNQTSFCGTVGMLGTLVFGTCLVLGAAAGLVQ